MGKWTQVWFDITYRQPRSLMVLGTLNNVGTLRLFLNFVFKKERERVRAMYLKHLDFVESRKILKK